MLKRSFDIIISLLLLALLALPLALLALWVRLDSPGPALYRARRVGRGGAPFAMLKLRTMHVDADARGPGLTVRDDPRITRVGRHLRRMRLDELPQLVNVLRGEMSLVGPRPESPSYVDLADPTWQRVLSVRPGICGLAQLTFAGIEAQRLTSHADADGDYLREVLPAKLQVDLRYVERASLAADLGILLQTALLLAEALVPRDGQPSPRAATRARRCLHQLARVVPLMALDALGLVVALWLAMAFRFDGAIPPASAQGLLLALPAATGMFLLANLLFGLYRRIWRYASAAEVLTILAASMIASAGLVLLIVGSIGRSVVPLGVALLGGVLAACAFTVVRYRDRLLTGAMGRLQRLVGSPQRTRVLIVGAGAAGQFLGWQLRVLPGHRNLELVGYVDDDPAKLGLQVRGAEVLGSRDAIPRLVAERGVGLIIIAIHRIPGPDMRAILALCLTTNAKIKLLPDFLGSVERSDGALPLEDIRPEDLLGRQLCPVDRDACARLVAGRTVLVTGAAGSIGSELARQLLALGPRRLVLLDNNESGLYDLRLALGPADVDVVTVVADVTSRERLSAMFAAHQPQLVFHAAAYKHVPLMEQYPAEAVLTNVHGTHNLIVACERFGVERFVLISTDKAVRPSSVMGATKRVCELLMIAAAARTGALRGRQLFTAVRFGNVLGSRGSVVPTFAGQIERGEAVTVTHPEMTRYFISISEAVSLTIEAASLTRGGDIFMLDMGQSLRIVDLAAKMIRLRGLRPNVDVPIVFSGVRPGEKLHEELVAPDEQQQPTANPRIFRISGGELPHAAAIVDRAELLARLARQQRDAALRAALWATVAGEPVEVPAEHHEERLPVVLSRALGRQMPAE